jgi:hypothetical protein
MTTQSYFERDVTVNHEGCTFALTLEEQRACERHGNGWHGQGDPSTSLTADIVRVARRKCEGAPEAVARERAARALGITASKVDSSIEWHENYMRWHDGDSNDEP